MKGITKLKLAFFTFIICTGGCFAQGSSKFKVVLDPGHGGKDYGAIYHGFIEKNIALNVALKVGRILEKDPSIDVQFTRKTDVFIELTERANIANDAAANIFVSVHCNGAANQTAYGTETFVMGITRNASNLEVAKKENAVIYLEKDFKVKYKGYDPNSPESLLGLQVMQEEFLDQSIELASKIESGISTGLNRKSRGVKQAGFLVLRNIYMPRVLVELGFISNKTEGEYLNSEAGQDKLAQAIANAIISYKKEYFIPGSRDNNQPVAARDTKPEPAQPKATEPKPSESKPAASAASGVTFKVQIAASGKNMETVPSNFNGLSNVSKDASTSVIKYFYGETKEYTRAKELLGEAKAKGYTSAFVVAFRDGKKINIQEALKKG